MGQGGGSKWGGRGKSPPMEIRFNIDLPEVTDFPFCFLSLKRGDEGQRGQGRGVRKFLNRV